VSLTNIGSLRIYVTNVLVKYLKEKNVHVNEWSRLV